MKSIEINSHCKINFGLNIVNKRDDGFHDIETVFLPINLADKLVFKVSESKSFTTNNELLNSEGANLVLKAVSLLEERFNRVFNISIKLEKNIPIGAGLGGGSSNAAVTLISIIELFRLELPDGDLQNIALKLGSDVPFFLKPKPSFATSRGEKLTPINFDINSPILIINPGIHISTKWAYQNVRPQKPDYSLLSLNNFNTQNISELNGKVINDFEQKCFEAFPEIKAIKNDLLKAGALFALMTGSGSSVFGVFEDFESALAAEQKYSGKYFTYINN